MRIKYAYLGISRNFIYTLLLIIQLMFAFNVIYENLYLNAKVSKETENITRFFQNKKLYSLEKVSSPNQSQINQKEIEKNIGNILNDLNNSSSYKFIQITRYALPLEKFDSYNEFKANNFEFKQNNKDFFSAKNYIVNKNFLSNYPIQLESGRTFVDNEFERAYGDNNVIPIIIGYNYSKIYNVGDEVEYVRGEDGIRKGKVIGIVKKNQYIPGDLISDNNRYVNLDNYILTTNSLERNNNITLSDVFAGNYIYFDNKKNQNDINMVSDNIKKTFEDKLNTKVGLRDLKEYQQAEMYIFGIQQNIVLVSAIIIILFVSLTLIISILNTIIKRKKEFGIHIFSGGTLKDISITIYLEVLLVLIFAYILSIPLIIKINKNLDFISIFILFIILIFISILVSIVPIFKIKNLNIAELVKGDE